MMTVITIVAPKRPWQSILVRALPTPSRQRWPSARHATKIHHLSATRHLTSTSDKSFNRSDPTAKRPTQKCDPYGLSGQSLGIQECSTLLSTIHDGWRLTHLDHDRQSPRFLEKQFYHETFHTASRFLSHISLLCTNVNHYPYLSIERVLVDDVNKYRKDACTNTTDGSSKKMRKCKGWIFVSTIKCYTYRPLLTKVEKEVQEHDDLTHMDKGLTYHDFHLAMSIDVETNREEVQQLLLKVEQS